MTWCWGENLDWQLGSGVTKDTTNVPVLAPDAPAFARIAAGSSVTCGLTAAAEAWCWGRNMFGQLGNGTLADSRTANRVLLNEPIASLALNTHGPHHCATTRTGDAWCWGWNADGQLGDGTTVNSSTPVPVRAP
ncbi:MAG TPA: hypothetical protein VF981_02500 [Gemmatimonadaceae bacterium]